MINKIFLDGTVTCAKLKVAARQLEDESMKIAMITLVLAVGTMFAQTPTTSTTKSTTAAKSTSKANAKAKSTAKGKANAKSTTATKGTTTTK